MASKDSRYIVGIDLGTTHTVVAYVDTTRGPDAPIEELSIEQLVAPGEIEARPLLHSLRYHYADGELSEDDRQLPWNPPALEGVPDGVVGQLALDLGAKVPGRLVPSAKSWLSHPQVDRTAAILPWGAPEEVPKISPVAASASYLAHVRSAWDHHFPDEPLRQQSTVLTVPASFDEGARALTLQAAKLAGLGRVRLLEEPQAAFYDWLGRHEEQIDELVSRMHLALVVDVGGGTTDLTLIQVELRESGPRLTRVAVGDHLMLGGDNMDLALAHAAEARLKSSKKLGAGQFTQLIQQCRTAKERLLAEDAPEKAKVTVLGGGSKLIGGAKSAELSRDEVHERIRDGFFPAVGLDARPSKKRGAIVEFGLPYVADAGITRHVAAFLDRHSDVAREAFGEGAFGPDELAVPDAVLLNGGVFKGHALTARMLDVLGDWRGGEAPMRLENPAPELAVARGAVAYGLARRGIGVRIGGGSARSYYLLLGDADETPRRGVCILPRGAEEGEEVVLKSRTFSLQLGQPVRFPLASSTGEAVLHRPGDIVEVEGGRYQELPPLAAVLEDESGDAGDKIPVRVTSALTEVGTVELSCIAAEGKERRWKLELQLRGEAAGGDPAATKVTQLHPRFEEATALIREVYGKRSSKAEGAKPVKTLRTALEKTLGARETWNTPLLRELFGALFAGVKRRRRSHDHERVWFNLVGYTLRPGFGYPLDEWRVKQLWEIFAQGVQFVPEAQNWSEWWTMWRRVAGGLDATQQEAILDDIAWYLHPPTPRPRKRPKGPKKQGYDDMVRLAASLERVPAERKVEVGGWLVERLTEHDEGDYSWWALGRLGARVPFFGSAHNVVPSDVAEEWLGHVLEVDWAQSNDAPFAATVLSRVSGDRQRDVSEASRERVAERLEAHQAPASWVEMVREVTELEAADERRIFGESLPPGLALVE
ncbi:MAG TPA: Hsp70 family protein [Sandaracinaceae bacterium LLY-WYZ-13_1]|nr:Hsp70 family protein [Sandaracinaceae bacterium LLY-WYZ-13_1]